VLVLRARRVLVAGAVGLVAAVASAAVLAAVLAAVVRVVAGAVWEAGAVVVVVVAAAAGVTARCPLVRKPRSG
jgi:hypothetical protein